MDGARGDEGQLSAGLVDAYSPLIGRTLEALIWMPIGADTPSVVEDRKLASFTFSGGALLAFAGCPEVFLTWTKSYPYLLEATTELVAWSPFSLERLRASPEPPWEQVDGQQLLRVELFTLPNLNAGVVGLRHHFATATGETQLWVGTGDADGVQDGDDLWVGVGVDPPNFAALSRLLTIGGSD